ncbi:MAG: ribose 5-phosphate isomerase B [Cyanobacteria bacterium]|nr:ribose 5-phosphate isomerase B [Cyanobacteriota bacterium]
MPTFPFDTQKIIPIGSDHAGFELKKHLIPYLQEKGFIIEDLGCFDSSRVDYPSVANDVMSAFKQYNSERAILCCGSGIGMGIAANRFSFARAVVANDLFSAKMSRRHNNSNVLCLGGRVLGLDLAVDIVDTWLSTPFDGGRHESRVALLAKSRS